MLFGFRQQSDVFADALVADAASQLMFLSVYGRDTSLQQLLARFQLKANEGGIDRLTAEHDGQRTDVFLGDPNRFEKFTGRLPRENLFGNLAHAWIYDPRIVRPDRSNRESWVLLRHNDSPGESAATQEFWDAIRLLSPVPLLEHWREPVRHAMPGLISPAMSIGSVAAYRVALPESFACDVSALVKAGELALDAQAFLLAAA